MIPVRVRFGWLVSLLVVAPALAFALAGCGDDVISPAPQNPQHISIRYLLVGFAGSVPGQPVTRSPAQAESLALALHARALAGEDFGDLTAAYSDSPSRDTIAVANYGVVPATGEYPRSALVRGFGDVAFAIAADSIGLAPYDSVACPFGWFLIHRIE
jgi:hypothetical protein